MEIKKIRAQVTGRSPQELTRARAMLDAEIAGSAQRGQGTGHMRMLRRRPVIAAGALTVAAALAAAMLSLRPAPGGQDTRPGTAGLTARYVLDNAAAAAESKRPTVPRMDQYIYVSMVTSDGRTEGWTSVDQHRWSLYHEIIGTKSFWDSYLPVNVGRKLTPWRRDDVGVVDEAVDHGGGDGVVAEDLAPAAIPAVHGPARFEAKIDPAKEGLVPGVPVTTGLIRPRSGRVLPKCLSCARPLRSVPAGGDRGQEGQTASAEGGV